MTDTFVEPRKLSLFARMFIILLVIIALLGLVNLALYGLKALDRPARPRTGQLLYASTFDAFNEEWSQFQGQMSSQIEDGRLKIAINASRDGAFSVLNHDFSDFDVRVNATRLTAPDDYNELGVLFRYHDPADYYIFKIRGDGYYRVERRKEGQTEILSEWHASPAVLIGVNAVNQLRVVGKGDSFQFYVNDQPLILCPAGPQKLKSTWSGDQCLSNNKETSARLLDESFDFGKIGVGVRADVPGVQVAFDDVLVYGP
jgi:hypothetical protein